MSPEVETSRRGSRLVRFPEPLATKLVEVCEVEGISSAEFLEPLVATEIENRHAANLPAIMVLREARERARKLRDEPAELQPELGENGGA